MAQSRPKQLIDSLHYLSIDCVRVFSSYAYFLERKKVLR